MNDNSLQKSKTIASVARDLAPVEKIVKHEEKFLQKLSETGLLARSAFAIGVSRENIYSYRQRHPEFDIACEQALALFIDKIGERVAELAFGKKEPVYFKGQLVGHRESYDIRALEMLAKKYDPGFSDKLRVDATVKAGVLMIDDRSLDGDAWVKKHGK